MKRREIREQIFKLLFRVEFNEIIEMEQQKALALDDEECKANEKDKEEISAKLDSIVEILPEIDQIIKDNMEGWTLERVGKVELTILRLAVYEIKYDESVPDTVAINEAVELSKKYGQEDAGSFVNGILAKVIKA
ncbi:MAG TPA: transcription antitermination factor NusB [Lachnospiraceae bacterium]|jgi:N utilization substance protein B|nr:transcription antitermination factor NusB [Lachnospiraceae bacterium]